MASNKWSFLWRKVARIRLPSSRFSDDHLRGNLGAAISNFCTIIPSSVTSDDNFCTNRNNNNSSPQQQQQQQQQQHLCINNSSSVVAELEFKVMSSAASPLPSRFLPPPPPPVVLMLPSLEVYGVRELRIGYYEGFLCLGDNRIKRLRKDLPGYITNADCKGSSNGWLAFVDHRYCGLYLVDLFSSSSRIPRIVPLPSIFSLPDFKEEITIIEDPPSSSSSSWEKRTLKYNYILEYEADGTVTERGPKQTSSLLIKRLAMSSDGGEGVGVVMMCPGDGHGLAFCRHGDCVWTPLPGSTQVEDVVYSRKDRLFYSILTRDTNSEFNTADNKGQILAWDFNNADDNGIPKRIVFDFDIHLSDFDSPHFFHEQVNNNCFSIYYYLVELPEGDILFLVRYSVYIGEDGSFFCAAGSPDEVNLPVRTAFFAAFNLDFEKQIAVPVKSLGDTALFVGVNESFSLSTPDHPELTANSIYFTDDKTECIYDPSYSYGGDDMGVYNFENYSVTSLYHPFQFNKIQPPPVWVVSSRP